MILNPRSFILSALISSQEYIYNGGALEVRASLLFRYTVTFTVLFYYLLVDIGASICQLKLASRISLVILVLVDILLFPHLSI